MIKRTFYCFIRSVLLRYGKRMDAKKMLERSRKNAMAIAMIAAQSSTAYRALLKEKGIDANALSNKTDLETLPVLTKNNTFGQASLNALVRSVATENIADVLTSSGSGGTTFGFKLTTRKQQEGSWFDIDLGLQDVFDVDKYPTLVINCLPMGVVFRSRAVTVANVSVREDMACSILRALGPRFAQTIVCCDPIFIRQLLHEGARVGVDWEALNTSLIMGEEVLVESQREYIAGKLGIDLDHDPKRIIGSSYGAAELGLNLLFETRDTIRLRRAVRINSDANALLGFDTCTLSAPSLFCFNPMRCHIEVLNPNAEGFGELCFTLLDKNALILLPRYATGDWGKILDADRIKNTCSMIGCRAPWLPMVAVQGRIRDRVQGIPSVEDIKEMLYEIPAFADKLSGAFIMELRDDANILMLTLQLAKGVEKIDLELIVKFQDLLSSSSKTKEIFLDFHASESNIWSPLLDYERKFSYMR